MALGVQHIKFGAIVCYAGDELLVSLDASGEVEVAVLRANPLPAIQSAAEFLAACGIIPF